MRGVPEKLGLETDLEIHYLTKLLIWGKCVPDTIAGSIRD